MYNLYGLSYTLWIKGVRWPHSRKCKISFYPTGWVGYGIYPIGHQYVQYCSQWNIKGVGEPAMAAILPRIEGKYYTAIILFSPLLQNLDNKSPSIQGGQVGYHFWGSWGPGLLDLAVPCDLDPFIFYICVELHAWTPFANLDPWTWQVTANPATMPIALCRPCLMKIAGEWQISLLKACQVSCRRVILITCIFTPNLGESSLQLHFLRITPLRRRGLIMQSIKFIKPTSHLTHQDIIGIWHQFALCTVPPFAPSSFNSPLRMTRILLSPWK